MKRALADSIWWLGWFGITWYYAGRRNRQRAWDDFTANH